MNRLTRIISRMRGMDFYDYVNHADATLARLKAACWYSLFFGSIGRKSWIKRPSQIYAPANIHLGHGVRIEAGAVLYSVKRSAVAEYKGIIRIGDRTFLNKNCNATAAFGIWIGCDVAFGPNVFVCDFDHGYQEIGVSRLATPLLSKGPIVIGDRCWIGANACIASGVELGHDCVVGANSVVTRGFPPFTVVAGSPAVPIRKLDPESGRWIRITDYSKS